MAEARGGARGAALYEYLETLVFACVTVVLLCTFLFRVVRVDGESMVPTLQDGDFLLSSHAFYTPGRGDIVVITQPNDINSPLIKRVIAQEGDTIDIDYEKGLVLLNGQVQQEGYILEATHYQPAKATPLPLTVPAGMVFAMGDNRNGSSDSRDAHIGLIDKRYIMGKTFFRLFPLDGWGVVR